MSDITNFLDNFVNAKPKIEVDLGSGYVDYTDSLQGGFSWLEQLTENNYGYVETIFDCDLKIENPDAQFQEVGNPVRVSLVVSDDAFLTSYAHIVFEGQSSDRTINNFDEVQIKAKGLFDKYLLTKLTNEIKQDEIDTVADEVITQAFDGSGYTVTVPTDNEDVIFRQNIGTFQNNFQPILDSFFGILRKKGTDIELIKTKTIMDGTYTPVETFDRSEVTKFMTGRLNQNQYFNQVKVVGNEVVRIPDVSTSANVSALHFDRSNENAAYFLVPGNMPAALRIVGDWTYEGWLNPDFDGVSWTDKVLVECDGVTNRRLYAVFHLIDGKLRVRHTDGTTTTQLTTTNSFLVDDVWTHIAVTRDATAKKYKFYKSGSFVEEISYTVNPTIGANDQQLVLAGLAPYVGATDDTYFEGEMDEVRIWDVERNATEILSFYQTRLPASATPVASWRMDDNLGQTVTDSENSYDLYLSSPNPATWVTSGIPSIFLETLFFDSTSLSNNALKPSGVTFYTVGFGNNILASSVNSVTYVVREENNDTSTDRTVDVDLLESVVNEDGKVTLKLDNTSSDLLYLRELTIDGTGIKILANIEEIEELPALATDEQLKEIKVESYAIQNETMVGNTVDRIKEMDNNLIKFEAIGKPNLTAGDVITVTDRTATEDYLLLELDNEWDISWLCTYTAMRID